MDRAQARPGQVGDALGQTGCLLLDGSTGRPLLHEAPAGPLGHADDGVGEEPAVVVVEAGIDERLDRRRDG